MTTQTEALKLALVALDIVKIHYTQNRHVNEAITAIKEALNSPDGEAQPEQVWVEGYGENASGYVNSQPEQERLRVGDSRFEEWFSEHTFNGGDKQRAREAYEAGMNDRLAQPEQDYPTDEHGYPIYSNGTHADISKAHAKFESRFEPESIWIGTGHLREILNGNTLNAYCSPEQDRFTDVQLYTTPPQPKEPEQEPVAWMTPDGEGFRIRFSPPVNDVPLGWDALYTTPPQRKPLTDEAKAVVDAARTAMDDSVEAYDGEGSIKISSDLAASLSLCLDEYDRAIEAVHGIKE